MEKRHVLVTRFGGDDKSGSALAFSTTPHLLDIVHGRSDESKGHSAKCASLRDLHLEIRWLATIKPSQVFPLQI